MYRRITRGWDGKGGRRGARAHDAPHASDEAAHPGGEGPAAQQHSIRPGPVRGTGGPVPRRRRPAVTRRTLAPRPLRREGRRGARNRNGIPPWTWVSGWDWGRGGIRNLRGRIQLRRRRYLPMLLPHDMMMRRDGSGRDEAFRFD